MNKIQGKCFSCGYYVFDTEKSRNDSMNPQVNYWSNNQTGQQRESRVSSLSIEEISEYPVQGLSNRGIGIQACERFGVRVALSTKDGATQLSHFYPVYRKSKLSGYKERVVLTKDFFTHGNTTSPDLFGQHLCNPSSKTLFITEGEVDCLSVYQTLRKYSKLEDWHPSVVSLPSGSTAGASSIANNLSFVDQYEKVVLVLDEDEAGEKATQEICRILAGKVYTVKLGYKDPNEMIMAGKDNDLYWILQTKATKYQPDGIINGADTWELFTHSSNVPSYMSPWEPLNEATLGFAEGDVIVLTGGTGGGKTTIFNQMEHHFIVTTQEKLADITLESRVGRTVRDIISIHLGKPLKNPHVKQTIPEETIRQAHTLLFGDRRVELYDHFGGMDDDNLFSKLRFFAASGCKFFFLDHLSIIVSEFATDGDERRRIDTLMTKLKKFAIEWGIILFLIVHLKKHDQGGKSFEEGAMPTLDDLRGSTTLKQIPDTILAFSRNQQHPDPEIRSTAKVALLKARESGETNPELMYLKFDKNTGRYNLTPKPMGYDKNIKFKGDDNDDI
jgi:twinkle protein